MGLPGMNAIYYWPYQLSAKAPPNGRTASRNLAGVLLRFHSGFGCLQPWPEFGDATLDQHLRWLEEGRSSPLIRRALDCCRIDGDARVQGRSLFSGLTIPPSHAFAATLPSPEQCRRWAADGFLAVKLKVPAERETWTEDFVALVENLADLGLLFRLDCNALPAAAEIHRWIMALPPEVQERIEFIEDPCPFIAREWHALRELTRIPLALDWCAESDPDPSAYDIRVCKPSREQVSSSPSQLVITTAMDHPIGQFFAAYEAARHFDEVNVCGLLSHQLFRPDAFLERVASNGPLLSAPEGCGLGFDDLLEALPWKQVN